MKKAIVIILVYIIAFVFFNIIPILTIENYYLDRNNPEITHCSLNYITCFCTVCNDDNFPDIIRGEIYTNFIFPILLPLLTVLITYFILKKFKYFK